MGRYSLQKNTGFAGEKQRIEGMVENLGLCPLFPKGRHRETKKKIEYKRV